MLTGAVGVGRGLVGELESVSPSGPRQCQHHQDSNQGVGNPILAINGRYIATGCIAFRDP